MTPLDLTSIVIAIIGAIVSIAVARIQAGNKAEKTTKAVINNGFGTEIRNKMADMQGLIDSMAERLNTYTVVRLDRDDLIRQIDHCPVEGCPLRKARHHHE